VGVCVNISLDVCVYVYVCMCVCLHECVCVLSGRVMGREGGKLGVFLCASGCI